MPSIPEQLLNSLSSLDHFNREAFIEAHKVENRITSIRLNPFKTVELDFELRQAVAWCEGGFYLEERPSFTYDPLFHAGCYYAQEAGSMFLETALKQHLNLSANLNVLDLCAAPGGKSTLINSLLSPDSLLVANEFVKSRAGVLAYNLSKWGAGNTVVTNNDPSRFSGLTSYFDAIVVDAPCSGSGLFRKQPEAIEEWSEAAVNACAVRQKDMLKDVIPALKEHGLLVYSTCSYSTAENEDMVNWMMEEFGMEYLPMVIPNNQGIVETERGFRFYPHLTKSEGFFCAVLRKVTSETPVRPKAKDLMKPSKSELEIISNFLSSGVIIKKNDRFYSANDSVLSFLSAFEKHFYFKKAGVCIGEIKGKDLIPDHELALYPGLNESINRVDLDKENAIQFLKKNSFAVGQSHRGFSLINYKNQGIGWVKLLPNRVNNYLPNEFRILN